MNGLTRRQSEVIECLVAHWSLEGAPPTFREIMAITGIKSTNVVLSHLKRLEKKGFVRLISGKRCSVRLSPELQRRIVRAWAARLGLVVATPETHAWASEVGP